MERLTTTLLTGAAVSAMAVAPAIAGHAITGLRHDVLPRGHSLGLAVKTANGIKVFDVLHQKTNVHGLNSPKTIKTNYYTTYTFTTHSGFCYHTVASCYGSRTWHYSGAEATWIKTPMNLANAVAWESETCPHFSTTTKSGYTEYVETCTVANAAHSKGKASVKPAHGKLKAWTVAENTAFHTTFAVHTYYCTTYNCYSGTAISYYVKETINYNIVFDGPQYTLKSKTATSDAGQFDVSDKVTYTYTTTTTGTKHKKVKHELIFNGRVNTNLALSFTH